MMNFVFKMMNSADTIWEKVQKLELKRIINEREYTVPFCVK